MEDREITISLTLRVLDPDAVVRAGDRAIRDGWGEESIASYLADTGGDPVEQALYEILTGGLWTMLAPGEDEALAGCVEIVKESIA